MRAIALILLTVLGCARDDHKPTPPTLAGRPMMDPVPTGMEVALLAGGCFWGMEEILRKVPGVVDTEVGYVAGAEAVRIVFDPAQLNYTTLLERWYFRMHDPTTLGRQGNDIGAQYRSAIFYRSEDQRVIAEQIKARVDASGRWKKPVVTEITRAGEFAVADAHHQDYLQHRPDGYTCHYLRAE